MHSCFDFLASALIRSISLMIGPISRTILAITRSDRISSIADVSWFSRRWYSSSSASPRRSCRTTPYTHDPSTPTRSVDLLARLRLSSAFVLGTRLPLTVLSPAREDAEPSRRGRSRDIVIVTVAIRVTIRIRGLFLTTWSPTGRHR